MVNAIGIDLGTSKCCVGVFRDGKVDIIPNEFGNHLTPSYIAFTDTGPIIGDRAKTELTENPKNTTFAFLCFLGYKPDNTYKDRKHWPFRVSSTYSDTSRSDVPVRTNDWTKYYPPELLVAMLLIKLKESAEAFLGSSVKDVVITVPVTLNYHYRHALLDAAKIAGLNVLRFVAAPEAAAIAYGPDVKTPQKRNVLVFDFGGGTLDYSIVTFEDGKFNVVITGSNNQTGGEDLDNLLFKYFVAEISRKHIANILCNDVYHNARARLLAACQRVKETLSTSSEASIVLDKLTYNIDFNTTITRPYYEGLCFSLFQKASDAVKEALDNTGMRRADIDDVVLVGGCSRIPMIPKMLSEFFGGKASVKLFDLDEAAAKGAAIQAALLSDDKTESIQNLLLPEAMPFTVNVENSDGSMKSVIKRNTVLPAKNTVIVNRILLAKSELTVKIYAGEKGKAEGNYFLGEVKFVDFAKPPGGYVDIEFTFEADVNGILIVSGCNEYLGKSTVLTVPEPKCRFSKEKIANLTDVAKQLMREEKLLRECVAAKDRLTDYCSHTMETIEENKRKRRLQEQEEMKVYKKCKKTLDWVNRNKTASKKQFEELLEKVEGGGKLNGNDTVA